MTDETKPASVADVVEAMCSAVFFKPIVAAGRLTMIDALTAARSLGVLMPEEAAGLRKDRDDAIEVAHAATLTRNAGRAHIAARLKVAEEALGKVAGIANECTWAPKTRLLANDLADIVRAALTPPPAAKDAET